MNTYFRTGVVTLLLGFSLTACHEAKKSDTSAESTASERKLDFQSDDEFLTYIQKAHFNYMWEGAEPTSGLACERIHTDGVYPENDADIVTTGGSGFGIAGLLVGIERGFITREEGVARFHQIADYLAKADRFHGVWPHWMHGPTGKVKPFGQKDNGGDLVESAFLMQGLLCVRQYFKDGNASEKALAAKIDQLWREMEWTWYLNGQDVLYWHWSPNYGFEKNLPIRGWNECLITYVLAASSPTYPIDKAVYEAGWARNGGLKNGNTYYGYKLPLGADKGGPLFLSQYSFLGINPKGLKDQYADYWEQNQNHTLINYNYCKENPKGYAGYGASCWGLTASDGDNGYSAHSPTNDKGVIAPTAALSAFPYTPEESMSALHFYYYKMGDKLWRDYGFVDAFNLTANWYDNQCIAIDQGPIICMIENYRTGMLWNLFMAIPEIQQGMKKLGFESPALN